MAAARKSAGMLAPLKKWAYNLSGFNKYGLHRDDVLYEDADVTEALRRLPERLIDERNFRIMRALQLSAQKTILPKDQWTKFEEDSKYLTPYIEEVKRERKEREEWLKNH
ncbi:cytochrome b-c1 complex subunit 7-like [Bacillus rossius redtenbacheri]|uniref:cytochrome b-c1 complex subunit 7-like n=1 Tax=Bacillus rossius redtenbacheri TaxID=93214 RepID=UPI002FDDD764